jgi:hypothetical protein
MAQRFIAFLLLLLHINGAMLLPQVDELDVYYNGQQVDDINSFVEYIQQEVLNFVDNTPEDEDDDHNEEIRLLQFGNDIFEQKFQTAQIDFPASEDTNRRCVYASEKELLISFDILTPPPKA